MIRRPAHQLVVIDRQRFPDPSNDRDDVLGSTSKPETAVALAKRAKGEGLIIVEERDGRRREFSARTYNSADLEFAQSMAASRGESPPKKIDPYFGFTEYMTRTAKPTKVAVSFPTKTTRGRRKSADTR